MADSTGQYRLHNSIQDSKGIERLFSKTRHRPNSCYEFWRKHKARYLLRKPVKVDPFKKPWVPGLHQNGIWSSYPKYLTVPLLHQAAGWSHTGVVPPQTLSASIGVAPLFQRLKGSHSATQTLHLRPPNLETTLTTVSSHQRARNKGV